MQEPKLNFTFGVNKNIMKTLLPMTDFVLHQYSNNYHANTPTRIWNYAAFLKQPLKLEMFVPCDENGNVLQEPKEKVFSRENGAYEFDEYCKIYEKAKEKVLFEGFYWKGNYAVCMAEDEMIYIDDEFMQNMTIDKFLTTIITDLQLTTTALKQIGI